MEWFRQWLIGITVAAMLNAAAKNLMPKGGVRKIGGLTGGLVVLLAVLQPVYQLEESRLSEAFSPYISWKSDATAVAVNTDSLMKDIIESECSAYIQDKAKELGLVCRVTVICTDKMEGYPYPQYALIEGALKAEEREALSELLVQTLDIAEENQTYCTESGEGK